jgi:hypothetical protein
MRPKPKAAAATIKMKTRRPNIMSKKVPPVPVLRMAFSAVQWCLLCRNGSTRRSI